MGVSPEGQRTAFQVRQTATVSAMELREAVQRYAAGALAARTDAFIVCMAVEGNERSLQDKLAQLKEQYEFPIRLWDAAELTHLLRDEESLVRKFFGPYWAEVYFGPPASPRRRLDADALLLGPVEALNLKPKVEKAQRLAGTSPMSAAKLYEEIADVLHTRFPGHAGRFQRLRATALKEAGDPLASHDVLMELAIRDLFERAEPQLSASVASELRELHDAVDEVRQVRGAAVSHFAKWHESPDALGRIADCFDALKPNDPYAPFVRSSPRRGCGC